MPLLVMAFAAGAPQRRSREDRDGQLLLLIRVFAPVAYPIRNGKGKVKNALCYSVVKEQRRQDRKCLSLSMAKSERLDNLTF